MLLLQLPACCCSTLKLSGATASIPKAEGAPGKLELLLAEEKGLSRFAAAAAAGLPAAAAAEEPAAAHGLPGVEGCVANCPAAA